MNLWSVNSQVSSCDKIPLMSAAQHSPSLLSQKMEELRRLSPFKKEAKIQDDGAYVEGCLLNNNTIRLFEYVIDSDTKTTYVKGKFLGKGGFAHVHELTELATNKVYAGKIIPKSRLTKPHQKEKILKEIELHRTLLHKNVVQFHSYFEDKNNVYIIMEYCAKKSMVHVMKNRRMLTEPEVRYYMHQLAEGVQYIHAQKVIHRDLKLGNMLLSDTMEVKIGDFGLATYVNEGATGKSTVCGTPNYIAPEVLNVEGHGYGADIWAMGCIMYAMLVGQPPFETSTINETYARISSNKYSIPGNLSESARKLITSMLQKNPCDRPTASQILQHDFFVNGFMPKSLSCSCCVSQNKCTLDSPNSTRSTTQGEISGDVENLEYSLAALHVQTQTGMEQAKNKKMNQKKEKRGHGFHCSLRRKLTSVFSKNKDNKPKEYSAETLYDMLESCLQNMPKVTKSTASPVTGHTLLFITKWIDYSNKYGFGYQLSDHSVGVVYNDGSKITLSGDKTYVEYWPVNGTMVTHSTNEIPSQLNTRYTLLQYFSQYMEENLTDGGDARHRKRKQKAVIPQMKRWIRTSTSIVMQLNTGTLQVNLFGDHTKIIISGACHGLVTYINKDRKSNTYSLKDITRKGCEPCITGHIQYALSALRQFVEMDNEA